MTLDNWIEHAKILIGGNCKNNFEIKNCLEKGDEFFGPSNLSDSELCIIEIIKDDLASRLPKSEDEGRRSINYND